MASAERTATTVWEGDLAHGNGILSLTSGATGDLPVTWASRTERSDGKTSPEELIAAAHATCFAMAFSNTLNSAGSPPEKLTVDAVCALDRVEGGLKITTMNLDVRGRVPGIDAAKFQELAHKAEQGCPVSGALRNNVQINLTAHLE